MESKPEPPDIIALLRDADEQEIRERLSNLDAEAAALRTLLRAIRARQRARTTTGGSRDE